ncbi:MAG: HAD family hydrolase [Sarcina sp.]
MIKLIVTDMDGTLLNKKEELNEEFLKVFKELNEKNIIFAVASGRQRKNLQLKFAEIKDQLIMLAENGSCGFLGEKTLYKNELDKEILHKLIDIGRKNSHNMIICTDEMTYFENINEEFIVELKKYYENIMFVNDLKEVNESIIKYTVFDSKGAKENSFKIYDGLLREKVKISISGTKWLHIVSRNGGKEYGVEKLQELFNISKDETMVFGDSNNDLEMLSTASYSYAMENASDELKAVAKFIAPSNENNGVLETIKKEVLSEKPSSPEALEAAVTEVIEEDSVIEETEKTMVSKASIIEKTEVKEETPKVKKGKATSKTKKATKIVVQEKPKENVITELSEQSKETSPITSEEVHPFDDKSLEEKLLAILG